MLFDVCGSVLFYFYVLNIAPQTTPTMMQYKADEKNVFVVPTIINIAFYFLKW